MKLKIKVAISACLIGQKVRYNGQHKKSAYCLNTLSRWFDFVPICPEVEIGLGVPREPIHLVQKNQRITVKNISDHSQDHTKKLRQLAHEKKTAIHQVCGYIFMQKSPSCGLFRVKVHHNNGMPLAATAAGIYATQIQKNHPELAIEEAGRLNDIRLRENFIMRVFTADDWRRNVIKQPSSAALIDFHTRYKYLLFAHSVETYRLMGKVVGKQSHGNQQTVNQYQDLLTDCLSKPAPLKNHINVMYHILGYLKKIINNDAKKEIINMIERYREKAVNLIVPLTLLKHYVTIYKVDYMLKQKYLSPYPYELGLRNHL